MPAFLIFFNVFKKCFLLQVQIYKKVVMFCLQKIRPCKVDLNREKNGGVLSRKETKKNVKKKIHEKFSKKILSNKFNQTQSNKFHHTPSNKFNHTLNDAPQTPDQEVIEGALENLSKSDDEKSFQEKNICFSVGGAVNLNSWNQLKVAVDKK